MPRPIHFEILATDPEKVGTFYRDLFGWDIATSGSPQAYWLVTTGSDQTPGINGGIMHRHFPQAVINTINVESLDQTLVQVVTLGGQKVLGPHEIPGIGMHAYCADPEGNLFGVLQPVVR